MTTRLLAAFFALTLLLYGCKSGAESPPAAAPTQANPTAVAATPTVAEPTTAPTAPPTDTPEPASIEIRGDDDFKAWAQQALDLIEARAPDAYAEVMASIDVIDSVPAGSGMYVDEKRFAVGDETAHAPGYDEARQLIWFAGTIVHDAHHSALYIDGEPHAGKDAEVACLTVQKAALLLLTDEPFFANYVQGLIDGADDPANQYWTQPNRHW